jgi:hypothetical protein
VETPLAVVVRAPGSEVGEDELLALCREKLAATRSPRPSSSPTRCRAMRRARSSSASSARSTARCSPVSDALATP